MFCLGIFISIMYSVYCLPASSGEVPLLNFTLYPVFHNGMIIVPLDSRLAIHLHHWLIYLTFFAVGTVASIPTILLGFFAGQIIQGLSYGDCFQFICDNPYNIE
jgi:ABC-type phosphate transport system permease subunit